MSTQTTTSPFAPMVAGFVGGVVSTSLLLPLDVIKIRLQVTEDNRSSGTTRRLGTIRVARGIIKHEGIRGLWVGWTPAVIGSAVSWGGYFYFYESFKRKLVNYKLGATNDENTSRHPSTVLNSLDNFVLACTAGGVMVILTNPIWLIKTRIQLQMKQASEKLNIKPYKNMLDAARTIVRTEGLLALYRGAGPALLLTSHGGVQFVVYEFLRKHFHYHRASRDYEVRRRSVMERLELSAGYLTIGAIAKFAATTVTYPLQVIKARMQQRTESLELTSDGELNAVKREYSGMISTIRKMLKQEGARSFWKGLIPNAIRVAPGSAITFLTYETIMDWFTDFEHP